jgi:hypothetical protein
MKTYNEEKNAMAPTHQAAMDRLKKEGKVKWKDTTGVESRALIALVKKGLVVEVFQPYGNTYFKLPE